MHETVIAANLGEERRGIWEWVNSSNCQTGNAMMSTEDTPSHPGPAAFLPDPPPAR